MTPIPAALREFVIARAASRCEYCHIPQACQVATFAVDHVIPTALDGSTTIENLCLACPRCNARKWIHTSATDPETGEVVRLYNPRGDHWTEHFRWKPADPTRLEGLSPAGRATLVLLDINSPRCLAIRKWLSAVGLHPI